MPIIFKSKATGDLLMLTAHAGALLGNLGKSVSGAGVLTVEQMPDALTVLKSLEDGAPYRVEPADDDEAPLALMDEPVSLRKRAVPLVRMIEEALAAREPIVWGV